MKPVSLLLATVIVPAVHAQTLPAFPGADGAAKAASGGRGGTVYHVTKLNSAVDDPLRNTPGTLLYGLNSVSGPRTIVFDVAGTFHLGKMDTADWTSGGNAWDSTSRQSIGGSNITIAGQTAPGPVIIMGGTFKPSGNNIVIRNVIFAPGYGMRAFWEPGQSPPAAGKLPTSFTMDAIDVSGQNVMLDHLETYYFTDEAISCNEGADKLTIQYCLNAQGQNYQGHAYGHLLQPDTDHKLSFLNNLDAHIGSRLPRVGSEVGTGALNDFRNNVTYNWFGSGPGYAGANQYSKNNFIRNFYLAGPGGDSAWNTTGSGGTGIFNGASAAYTSVYANGNLKDTNKDADPNDTSSADGNYASSAIQSAAYDIDIGVTTDAAATYTRVMRHAGARWWERDFDFTLGNTAAIDTPAERIIREVSTGTGRIESWADDPVDSSATEGAEWLSLWALRPINGVAPYNRPAGWDTDGDGMPDAWETAHGLNPNVANNNADFDNDGYTDLEEYMNEVAAWPAPGTITFTGEDSARFARIFNWRVSGVAVNIAGQGSVTPFSYWQPSRHDTVLISGKSAVVDSAGQHAGILRLAGNASLSVTAGWLDIADQLEIGTGGSVTVQGSGALRVANRIVNNATLRLTGSAALTVGGSITNNGVLDVMTWTGTLPAIVNNGVVLDTSRVKVESVKVDGTNVILTIQGYAGHNYQFQRGAGVETGSWQDIGTPVAGANGPIVFTHPGGVSQGKGFYRVAVSP